MDIFTISPNHLCAFRNSCAKLRLNFNTSSTVIENIARKAINICEDLQLCVGSVQSALDLRGNYLGLCPAVGWDDDK